MQLNDKSSQRELTFPFSRLFIAVLPSFTQGLIFIFSYFQISIYSSHDQKDTSLRHAPTIFECCKMQLLFCVKLDVLFFCVCVLNDRFTASSFQA